MLNAGDIAAAVLIFVVGVVVLAIGEATRPSHLARTALLPFAAVFVAAEVILVVSAVTR